MSVYCQGKKIKKRYNKPLINTDTIIVVLFYHVVPKNYIFLLSYACIIITIEVWVLVKDQMFLFTFSWMKILSHWVVVNDVSTFSLSSEDTRSLYNNGDSLAYMFIVYMSQNKHSCKILNIYFFFIFF